jgi:hypothetical protein
MYSSTMRQWSRESFTPVHKQLVGVDAHRVAKHDVIEGVATHSAAPRALLDSDSNHHTQHVDGRRTARQ